MDTVLCDMCRKNKACTRFRAQEYRLLPALLPRKWKRVDLCEACYYNLFHGHTYLKSISQQALEMKKKKQLEEINRFSSHKGDNNEF